MRYRQLFAGRFFEITGLITAIIGIVLIIASIDGETMDVLSRCGSGNVACKITFAISVTLGVLISAWAGLLLFALFLDKYSSAMVAQNERVAKQVANSKIMTLAKEDLKDNRLDLRIYNNEDDDVEITAVYIGHKAALSEREEPPWSRASLMPSVPIPKHSSITTSFIIESRDKTCFRTIDHDERIKLSSFEYYPGVHKFDVKVVYNSKEQKLNGGIKWFRVIVDYKRPSSFDVEIQHMDGRK